MQLSDLHHLFAQHASEAPAQRPEFNLRGQSFGRTPSLMGVVNMSKDSWYRESVVLSVDAAIQRGRLLKVQGAALVDVGAESTLPNAERVSAAQQLEQLRPVVQTLAQEGVQVSVETYEKDVVAGSLEAGAAVINLTGRKGTREVYELIGAHEAGVIICFVAGDHVRSVEDRQLLEDPIPELYEYFAREIETATKLGVRRIWVDPGLGFYYRNLLDSQARVRFQLSNFLNVFRLERLGFPICNALPHAFEQFQEEVRTAEAMFAVIAQLGGTTLFRTHEVPKVKGVLDTLQLWSPK